MAVISLQPRLAVAVVYGLIIGLFVYRELKWKDIPKTFVNAARTSAAVMMIIVTAEIGRAHV